MILLDATGLGAARPERPLFGDVSLTVSSGDRLAIVGLNGCGKSTLLRMLAGTAQPDSGTVQRGRGARIVLLDQEAALPAGLVSEAIGDGWETASVIDKLGMTPLLDAEVSSLSGGQAKRVALARALVEVGPPGSHDDDSVLLILDEPTNHLDIDVIAWLEDRLAGHRGGLLMVSHDRHVLDRVTTRILELDRGRAYLHEGGYASYLEGKAERAERAAGAEAVRRNLARTELAWLRRGAPAGTSKPKARIESATALVEGRAEAEARPTADLPLHFGTPRLGDTVIEAHGVGHRFGDDGPWLFRNVDLLLDNRERLGIVGPNGAGKSTLLKVLAGQITPAEGRGVHGATAVLGMYDQKGMDLDPNLRVREAVAGPRRAPDWQDSRLLEAFWFDADAQRAPISLLSGGERRRLQLLLTLQAKPDVVLLDEPTNDLDLDTLRSLEDFLEDFPGAVVIVSHDRALLERTVTDVLVIDDQHDAQRVPGGYAAWEGARRAAAAARPQKLGGGQRSTSATPAASKAPPVAGGAAADGPAKRSRSTLRFLLKDVDKRMRQLEKRHAKLSADVEAATADHQRLAVLGAELANVAAALSEVEDEWLALTEESER